MDALEQSVQPPVIICAFDRALMGQYNCLTGEFCSGRESDVVLSKSSFTAQKTIMMSHKKVGRYRSYRPALKVHAVSGLGVRVSLRRRDLMC